MRLLLRKIRNRILWEKFFFNRGKSIISDFIELLTLTTIVGLFIDKINAIFQTNISIGKAMMAVPLLMIIDWIIGRLDYKKIHIIQVENEIQMKANPALYDKVCRIDDTLQKMQNESKA